MTRGNWTPERIAELRGLEAQKLSMAQIAVRMGISRGAVCGKLQRIGLQSGEREAGPSRWLASDGPRPVTIRRFSWEASQ